MSIQSILFDRNIYSLSEAKKWIKDHGYKESFNGKDVDIKPRHYRFRQLEPNSVYKYRTKSLSHGIKFIIEYKYEKKK
jgi:hypothetical protein